MTIHYKFTQQCEKEYWKFVKKYRSLPKDIERFCHMTLVHEEQPDFPLNNKNYTLLKRNIEVRVYKAKMPCITLRGNKFRVIYARHEHSLEIIVIELYTKNNTEREDAKRISEYLSLFHP